MNVNFEMAIQYINLEEYEKAVESLKTAISEEMDKGNEKESIEYTCVLGELYADLGRKKESIDEFLKVLEYCEKTNSLPKQQKIAKDFLDILFGEAKLVTEQRPAIETPINIMGMTSKGFIAKNQRKRGKK